MTIQYPWIEGEAYEVVLLTATGATIDHAIDAAAEIAGRGPRLLRADGADRPLRGRHPGRDRDALASLGADDGRALDALPARLHGRAARLPRHRRAARGHRACGRGRPGARRRGPRLARRRGRLPGAGGRGRLAAASAGRVGERGRRPGRARGLPGGARHRPPQPRRGPRDRLRLRGRLARARRRARGRLRAPQHHRGPGDRGAGRALRDARRARTLMLLGVLAGRPGDPRRLDRRVGLQPERWPRSCSASGPARSPR